MSLSIYLSAFHNIAPIPVPSVGRVHRVAKANEDVEFNARSGFQNHMTLAQSGLFKDALVAYVEERGGKVKTYDIWQHAFKNLRKVSENTIIYHLNTLSESGRLIKHVSAGRRPTMWSKP